MVEMYECADCEKEIPESDVFMFEGEETNPYCRGCYESLLDEGGYIECYVCGKLFSPELGGGNELGFCVKCQEKPDFPYDLDAYYEAVDNGVEVFKGLDTYPRGILDNYPASENTTPVERG